MEKITWSGSTEAMRLFLPGPEFTSREKIPLTVDDDSGVKDQEETRGGHFASPPLVDLRAPFCVYRHKLY